MKATPTTEQVDEFFDRLIETAPPFNDEQRTRLSAIFRAARSVPAQPQAKTSRDVAA
jgi:hypothetical protein